MAFRLILSPFPFQRKDVEALLQLGNDFNTVVLPGRVNWRYFQQYNQVLQEPRIGIQRSYLGSMLSSCILANLS